MKKGRPKPPKCPECGKSLYRTMEVGEKRTTSLYPYCRNVECAIYGDIRKHGYLPTEKGGGSNLPERCYDGSDKTDENVVKSVVGSNPEKDTRKKKKRKRKAVSSAEALNKAKEEVKAYKEKHKLCERCGRREDVCMCEKPEPEAIKVTREKLKKFVKGNDVKRVTALSVVMMLQGLGEYDMANVLLDKYDLLPLGIQSKNK